MEFYLTFFVFSAAVFVGVLIWSLAYFFRHSTEQRQMVNIFYICAAGVFLSATFLFYPHCYTVLKEANIFHYPIRAFLASAHTAIRLFLVDSAFSDMLDIVPVEPRALQSLYTFLGYLLYVIAPVLTVSALFTLFKSFISRFNFILNYHKNTYIFSDLNDRSLALATDIRKNDGKCMIIFTDVYAENNEISCELTAGARAIRAILFRNDITVENFHFHSNKTKLYFFIIGTNEAENISQSIALSNKYIKPKIFCTKQERLKYKENRGYDYKRKDTRLYLFSEKHSSEMHLSALSPDHMKLRRISVVQSTVHNVIYEHGRDIFFGINTDEAKSHPLIAIDSNTPIPDASDENTFKTDSPRPTGKKILNPATGEYEDEKLISAMIIGAGLYGTEMIRTLSWFCQMHPYRLEINAFDKSKNAASRLRSLCPEMFDCNLAEENDGAEIEENTVKYHNGDFDTPGEAHYKISVYQDCDTSLYSFDEMVANFPETTYVFVALGDDDENIKTATKVRILLRRIGINPVIHTVVYNPDNVDTLKNGTTYSGDHYGIVPLGSMKSVYSKKCILQTDFEKVALERHMKYTKHVINSSEDMTEEKAEKMLREAEDSFWKYDYNYRSSIASALHLQYKRTCKLPGSDKAPADRTEEEKWFFRELEHQRWNAYLRSEGYVWAPKRDKLAKTHHLLIPFADLPYGEQIKDDD